MKKYKLIKEYPGSPELGTIVQQHCVEDYMSYKHTHTNVIEYRLVSNQMENQLEFWQEIVELCVPYGTKFKTTTGGTIVHTIEKFNDEVLILPNNTKYSIEQVNGFFKNKYWKVYEEIPEYVKCVKIWYDWEYDKNSILNHIYRTNVKPDFSNHTWKVITEKYFVPATKEEFDEQERDYEILSYTCPEGSIYAEPRIIMNPNNTIRWNLSDWTIHRVKRKSDGEIFKIGDVCCPKGYENTNNYHSIIRFDILAHNNSLRISSDNWYININNLVKQKKLDYQILSFKNSSTGKIYKQDSQINSFCEIDGKSPFLSLEFCLTNNHYNIHSVKRLSDGEVFTVGETLTSNHKITSFDLQAGTMLIWLEDRVSRWYSNIASLVKPKTPLFTTEDGVEIFEGDTCYFISANDWSIGRLQAQIYAQAYLAKARFSTKEKAEEYIWKNKPCLSYEEILKLYWETPSAHAFIAVLQNFIKTKVLNKT